MHTQIQNVAFSGMVIESCSEPSWLLPFLVVDLIFWGVVFYWTTVKVAYLEEEGKPAEKEEELPDHRPLDLWLTIFYGLLTMANIIQVGGLIEGTRMGALQPRLLR